jgi:class 3 adenylate cyclase
MEDPATRECAILFADVAGSTKLYETLGDQTAKEIVTHLQKEIVDQGVKAGGKVQEVVGDEVMLRFHQAAAAAICGMAIQGRVAAIASSEKAMPAVRIGLHFGSVIVEGRRLFGDTINVAARMTAIAQGGQIMLTQAVVDRLPDTLREIVRRFDVAALKGKRDPLVVYDLPWKTQDLTEISPVSRAAGDSAALALTYSHQHFTVTAGNADFSLGRDPSSDIVVSWPSVSRRHARIEFSRGRFVLADLSSNGTYLTVQSGQVVFLRRESIPLWGKGRIALGAPLQEGSGHSVGYCCS